MGFTYLGYGHPIYYQSLNEFGRPRELPRCGGSYLERRIPRTGYSDGMGAYPLFSCERWEYLREDLRAIGSRLVSFSAVLDPLGRYEETSLPECFPDVVLPFKRHFLIDFSKPLTMSRQHWRNARKATREVEVELSRYPIAWLDDWIGLYDRLIQRHRIGDIRRFSECSFTRQLKMPGMLALRALRENRTVGMVLFLVQNDSVYYHLGAYNDEGYGVCASYALFCSAIDYFSSQDFRWLNLGAGAGMVDDPEDGLSRFKRGWANDSRIAYFCGRILNHQAYSDIIREKNIPASPYFPAYRAGEFCKKSTEQLVASK